MCPGTFYLTASHLASTVYVHCIQIHCLHSQQRRCKLTEYCAAKRYVALHLVPVWTPSHPLLPVDKTLQERGGAVALGETTRSTTENQKWSDTFFTLFHPFNFHEVDGAVFRGRSFILGLLVACMCEGGVKVS